MYTDWREFKIPLIVVSLCRRFWGGQPGFGSGSGGKSRLCPDGGRCGQTKETDPARPDVGGGHAETTPEEVRTQPWTWSIRQSKTRLLF